LVLTSRDIVVVGGVIVRIEDGDPPPPNSGGGAEKTEPSKFSKVAVRFDKVSEADQERITCHILAAHRQRKMAAGLPTKVTRAERSPDAEAPAGPTSNSPEKQPG
jgi:ribosomal protein L24